MGGFARLLRGEGASAARAAFVARRAPARIVPALRRGTLTHVRSWSLRGRRTLPALAVQRSTRRLR